MLLPLNSGLNSLRRGIQRPRMRILEDGHLGMKLAIVIDMVSVRGRKGLGEWCTVAR